jgi:stress-induced morphogen
MLRERRIEELLRGKLAPRHLEIQNESHNHSVKPGSETHFKIVVVSDAFQGLNRVARHRLVHTVLESELKSGLHALTSSMFTAEEWSVGPTVLPSPECESKAKRPVSG